MNLHKIRRNKICFILMDDRKMIEIKNIPQEIQLSSQYVFCLVNAYLYTFSERSSEDQ